MKRIVVLLIAGLLFAAGAAAQQPSSPENNRIFVAQDNPVAQDSPAKVNFFFQSEPNQQVEQAFFLTEMTAGAELVTNAPYTATAVEESTQTLADGNRIVRKSSDFVARDSQGRTRRETTLNRVGPVQVDSPKLVFINDPTTHTQYVITPDGDTSKVIKTETNWGKGPMIVDRQKVVEMKRSAREKAIAGNQQVREIPEGHGEQVKHEDLGTQTIEGVSATGKRETVTIPAGQIGNDRPIDVVSETWFSPDLHTVVLRKHSDPRVGETVFRLTNISRTEPDATLFQLPANAKIKVEPLMELKRDNQPIELKRDSQPKD
ncbi:MAG TPA: hypothetical protein VKH81_24025 [Candidatus Angelobacter sp.]|nr:hypothetical protein [Candidatus Angelobacter sp.]